MENKANNDTENVIVYTKKMITLRKNLNDDSVRNYVKFTIEQ